MRKQGDNELQRKLRSYAKQYKEVKDRIHEVRDPSKQPDFAGIHRSLLRVSY